MLEQFFKEFVKDADQWLKSKDNVIKTLVIENFELKTHIAKLKTKNIQLKERLNEIKNM